MGRASLKEDLICGVNAGGSDSAVVTAAVIQPLGRYDSFSCTPQYTGIKGMTYG